MEVSKLIINKPKRDTTLQSSRKKKEHHPYSQLYSYKHISSSKRQSVDFLKYADKTSEEN
jgi:hypothetical protein